MFCPNCGNKLEEGQSFCGVCGKALDFMDDPTVGSFAPVVPVVSQPEYVEPIADEPTVDEPTVDEPTVDDPTAGSFETVAPVTPQYVSSSDDEPTVGSFPSFIPAAPQPEYVASSDDEPTVGSFAPFIPATPQPESVEPVAPVVPVDYQNTYAEPVAPVGDVPPAAPVEEKTAKKEKRRNAFLIGFFGAIALGLLVFIIALVSFITRPDVSIIRAAKKTILDSQSFSFEIYFDDQGKVAEGKVAFGQNHKDSGFYVTSGEEYEEFGYYNNTVYTSSGSRDISEGFEYINDSLGEMGLDITVEEALDMLIDEEINEKAIFEIYESQYDNLVEIFEERGIDVKLPDPKEVKSSALDIFKGIPEDAFDFEQDLGFGKKTIKYEVDLEKLLVGIIENLSEDEEYDEFFESYEDETGNDVDDIIDELEDSEFPDVEGKAVIEWGRLVEFSLKLDGEGFKIKFKDINKTEVNQKTMDAIEIIEDESEDDLYVEYPEEYSNDNYNYADEVVVPSVSVPPVTQDYYDDYYDDGYYDDYYDDSYYDDYYDDSYYDDYYDDSYYDDYYDDDYYDDDYYYDDYYDDDYYDDDYYYDEDDYYYDEDPTEDFYEDEYYDDYYGDDYYYGEEYYEYY